MTVFIVHLHIPTRGCFLGVVGAEAAGCQSGGEQRHSGTAH